MSHEQHPHHQRDFGHDAPAEPHADQQLAAGPSAPSPEITPTSGVTVGWPTNTPQRRRTGLMLVAAAAVLLVLSVGTMFAVVRLLNGGEKSAGDPLAVAWALPWSGERTGSFLKPGDATKEVWAGNGAVVRVQSDGIVAFRVQDGSVAWSTPIPDTTSICTASPTAPDGIGVFAYGGDKVCDKLAGIDLNTGKLTFDVSIEAKTGAPRMRARPTVVAGKGVAVVLSNGKVTAHAVTDGTPKWKTVPPAPPAPICIFDHVTAGSDRAYVSQACANTGLTGADSIMALDLATGKSVWTTEAEGTVEGFLSANPPVAYVTQKQKDGKDLAVFVAYGEDGAVAASVKRDDTDVRLDEGRTIRSIAEQDTVFVAAVHDKMLYLPSSQPGKNAIAALDLSTGKRKWLSPGVSRTPRIIRADAEGILVLETGIDTAQLVRMDAATGAPRVLSAGTFAMFELPLGTAKTLEVGGTVLIAPYLQGTSEKERALTAVR